VGTRTRSITELMNLLTEELSKLSHIHKDSLMFEFTQLVNAILNKIVIKIELVVYEYKGQIDEDDYQLQLTFEDNKILFLTGASDGESLRIDFEPWKNIWEGEQPKENIEFIKNYGKHILLDVSNDRRFMGFIDKRINHVRKIMVEGILCGVQLEFGRSWINFINEGDEGKIFFGRSPSALLNSPYKYYFKDVD
jgi:hypothetical protein